ncbi:tRNA-splicing endonuclease subunit sen54 [Kickxella alabastrina]|uniref:tRNA-splicing endonuclease subunit sen54 n=1 Tax=Kickxella alabastrina TaxID=61397 RepID=A0ACC1HYI3_9FUNG|nr:tRNA-splicing endonuclease subunit sen54 [Kickxella alabastrina]
MPKDKKTHDQSADEPPSTADDDAAADETGPAGLELYLNDTKKKNKGKAPTVALPGKTAAPVDTAEEQQAIDLLLGAYEQMISVSPKKSRKSCIGYWHPDGRLVSIPEKPIDLISRTSGRTSAGTINLQPEEWLLFVERGSLIISGQAGEETLEAKSQSEVDISAEWLAALGRAELSLDEYRAYGHLRRLGYVVVCPESGTRNKTLASASASASGLASGQMVLTDSFPFSSSIGSVAVKLGRRLSRLASFLVAGTRTYTFNDIFRALQRRAPKHTIASSAALFGGGYSLYKPEHPYKKRDPGQAQHRMVVENSQDSVPDAAKLMEWSRADCQQAAVVCVSEPGVAGYLKIRPFEAPDAPNRLQAAKAKQ